MLWLWFFNFCFLCVLLRSSEHSSVCKIISKACPKAKTSKRSCSGRFSLGFCFFVVFRCTYKVFGWHWAHSSIANNWGNNVFFLTLCLIFWVDNLCLLFFCWNFLHNWYCFDLGVFGIWWRDFGAEWFWD